MKQNGSSSWLSRSLSLMGSVSMLAIAQPALAQEAEEDDALRQEVVVVQGIRQSLQASTDLKRNAQGVVDAITSEDMGKFPDTNLAESLQRITGVSINRANGEGSQVTVRGFGPDFNLVLLNGRQMPTAFLTKVYTTSRSRTLETRKSHRRFQASSRIRSRMTHSASRSPEASRNASPAMRRSARRVAGAALIWAPRTTGARCPSLRMIRR